MPVDACTDAVRKSFSRLSVFPDPARRRPADTATAGGSTSPALPRYQAPGTTQLPPVTGKENIMQASRDYSNSVGSVEIAAVKSNIDLSMERHGGQANRLSETISQLYKRLNFVLHNGGAEAQANKADKPCSSSPLVKFIDDSTDELEHQCNRLDDILSRLPT